MTILVVGASGATGKHVVNQLLVNHHQVKVIVRSADKLPETWKKNKNLQIIEASLLDISKDDLNTYVKGCDAMASCLGHNLTWKGLFGHPKRLVTEATERLCHAITAAQLKKPVKFVLMNTSGNSNRDLNEPISFAQKCVIFLLRLLLPPHVDNEKAADYLRTEIGKNNTCIEWCAVRPDGLINENEVSAYELHPSPIRSAIFNAGKVSRINVGHFMASLITDDALWNTWKGQMPVIYSQSSNN